MLHKHSAAFNTGTLNSVTLNSAALKNAISNSGPFISATLKKCNT